MRAASSALITLLNTATQFLVADLLTIVQSDGTTTRLTGADLDLTAVSQVDGASHLFTSQGPPFTRGQTKLAIGLEVDTLKLTISPRNGIDILAGVPWPQAVRQGALDEAQVTLERLFLASWDDTSAGTLILFSGRVGQVDSFRDEIQIEVKSDLELLTETLMPRNLFQPGCMHTLFDAGCALLKSAFAVSGTAAASSTAISILTTLAAATGYFDLGSITMTSGANAGLSRAVRTWVTGSPGTLTLMRPFPFAPAPSDTFSIAPGCDKQISSASDVATFLSTGSRGDVRLGTCQVKFANLVHARGFPFVPNPEKAI
ncbi:MAG: DUF2163 domain-containing protein [Gemmatimonadales bacterium]